MTGTTEAALAAPATAGDAKSRYFRRFTPVERVLHALLMLSFVGLALTGLPLIFADRPWAADLARAFGGIDSAGRIHRICAFVMIVVFVTHVAMVVTRALTGGRLMAVLWGPDSMVPQPSDIVDIYRNFRWFLGLGPEPKFDRWTYWEKFDYWAVFWGMFIIGGSGLLLWFPVFFAHFLPGWMFNIAALVHGEEALLAVGFIFTFHFFNGHLRPRKFPMDTVVFTGRISEHELKDERPLEYERMAREGRLEQQRTTAPSEEAKWFGWVVGGVALVLGIVAIVLIISSVL
ncbi:MAG: cytochrome b/b6 domain-containing protein [Burkholderiales bacterium]